MIKEKDKALSGTIGLNTQLNIKLGKEIRQLEDENRKLSVDVNQMKKENESIPILKKKKYNL